MQRIESQAGDTFPSSTDLENFQEPEKTQVIDRFDSLEGPKSVHMTPSTYAYGFVTPLVFDPFTITYFQKKRKYQKRSSHSSPVVSSVFSVPDFL